MAYQYKVGGRVVRLEVDPNLVAVRFAENLPNSGRATATESAGAGPFTRRYEVPGEKITIVPAGILPVALPPAEASEAAPSSEKAIRSLNASPSVARAQPVFRVSGNQVVATDRLIVGLNDLGLAGGLAAKFDLQVKERGEDKVVFEIPAKADIRAAAEMRLAMAAEPVA